MTIICLEGPDYAGKTTIAYEIARIVEKRGQSPVYIRCPGSTKLGELLRGPLKDRDYDMSSMVRSLAFAAVDLDAMQMAERCSANGNIVIMDRCGLSNLAYRIAFEQWGELAMLNRMGDAVIKPKGAKIVKIDCTPAIARARMVKRVSTSTPGELDAVDLEGMSRWLNVSQAYEASDVRRHFTHFLYQDSENNSPQRCAEMVLRLTGLSSGADE